jgi:AraC-like DNA-binding protein
MAARAASINSTDMSKSSAPSIAGGLIQRVAFVDCICRPQRGRFQATSLPGHLLHLVCEGKVRQTAGGRTQHLGPGDVVWYFEDESVRGEILQAPWKFITINFEAPTLAPPPEDQRVQRASPEMAARFRELHRVWNDAEQPHITRHIQTHILLLQLLLELVPADQKALRLDAATQPWWAIEAKLRNRLDGPIDLSVLEGISGLSRRKIGEACELATGCSPLKRIKQIRLTYARGLVQHSALTISEIAYRVGYSRVQELSRDYHSFFKSTPRQERSEAPVYRRIEPVSARKVLP